MATAARQDPDGGLGAALRREPRHPPRPGGAGGRAADFGEPARPRGPRVRRVERRRHSTHRPASLISTSRTRVSCALPRVLSTRSRRRVCSSPSTVSSSTLSDR